MITKKNLLNHEIIGLEVKVMKTNISGIVVDETKNMLVVRTRTGAEKKVVKKNNVFEFVLPSGEKARVAGSMINLRAWDRLKKVPKVKNRWQKILG